MSLSLALQKELKFVRVVDVEPDTRHFQDDQRLAGFPHALAVWEEAVVAEAKRNNVCRPAQYAVTSPAIVGGNEHGALRRGRIKNLLELGACNQRDVCRNYNRGVVAAIFAPPARHFDGGCLAFVATVFDDAKFELC